MESVAFEAVMVACALLLQKPHFSSKASDHVAALERRLPVWRNGNIDELMKEGRTIQHRLDLTSRAHRISPDEKDDHAARTFSKLILGGKVHSALRFLSENACGGILSLDALLDDGKTTVRTVLQEKHPGPRDVHPDALIGVGATPIDTHPVAYDGITAECIQAAALHTQGSAGPSGMDAAAWRRICTSFHKESLELCSSIAACARRLCAEFVDPSSLTAFVACRLIPLDKRPGVRPIGVCEVLRRIVGKAIMSVIKKDVMSAAGPLQLCAGQDAGCEAAVHALHALFQQEDTEAVILVDASNAFNNLNRQVALRNIQFQCPIISRLLTNCYRGNAPLFVDGTALLSQEGITQGDPLSMAMFALATVALINSVATESATQIWFADDAGAGGSLAALRIWWDALNLAGPRFGYYPNEFKTTVVVKPEHQDKAEEIFQDTGLVISSEGKRYLGGCLGKDQFTRDFQKSTVSTWADEVGQLAKIAKSQPHAAFAALTHGLTSRWTYLTRVSPLDVDCLKPLEDVIRHKLIPALTGQPQPSDSVRQLLALPAKHGGLGIIDPTVLPARNFSASGKICAPLVKAILHQGGDVLAIQNEQRRIKAELRKKSSAELQASAAILSASLSEPLRRCTSAAQEKGASAWLTALPLDRHGFALHKGAFRDAVALRYGWSLNHTPSLCVCKEAFSADHALVCRYGGYPTLRHNEIRDVVANLLSEVCVNVSREPRLQPLTGERLPRSANTEDEARVDIKAQGFWGNGGQDAFFDVRVFHPNASSYKSTQLSSLYRLHETRKKLEYGRRIREVEHGSFTPLVFTTGGSMAPEATVFFRRLASLLSEKRNEPYSVIMNWIRCLISFSLLRSSLLCIRGSRSTRRSFCPATDSVSLIVAESRLNV